ncbi:hypothetical protein DSL72_008448 [Monilinia vaccinii-corymbosi]|uniref:L-lactate dehydrogenase (cytochrome) n=1 Tax=Monilinia vaccinii-corymbosi TaxID=61207 RepID=A0A8A3PJT5_9HELO|nr:hypothetical protein DSL72_008448 [Monilinia vaccinii-corymbosi]
MAGRDASKAYSEIHAPSLISSSLPVSKILGTMDLSSTTDEWAKLPSEVSKALKPASKPSLDNLINTYDFVSAAESFLTPKAWAFYSSAATDVITKGKNTSTYADIGLRPRILRNVKNVNTRTTMLGHDLNVPIFCSPAAMAKMAHPQGEQELARGLKSAGLAMAVSTNASFPIAEIFEAVSESHSHPSDEGKELPIFFQLYVDRERHKSEKLLKDVEALGVKAIFVTVDAPVPGKREADERVKADESISAPMSGAKAKNDEKGGALGRIMGAYIDATLSWSDIAWLRTCTKLPILLKGIQTSLDAKMALAHGIDGILISNHGGRSLDTSPASILVLLELQKNAPEVFDGMEVFIDGGIMRGTDIFKALCLGAKAVGIGRGFLFALGWGQEGVQKYVEILKDELETTMRMMGVTDISQVHPGMLNTRAVDHLIPDGEEDHPYAKWRPKARARLFECAHNLDQYPEVQKLNIQTELQPTLVFFTEIILVLEVQIIFAT